MICENITCVLSDNVKLSESCYKEVPFEYDGIQTVSIIILVLCVVIPAWDWSRERVANIILDFGFANFYCADNYTFDDYIKPLVGYAFVGATATLLLFGIQLNNKCDEFEGTENQQWYIWIVLPIGIVASIISCMVYNFEFRFGAKLAEDQACSFCYSA